MKIESHHTVVEKMGVVQEVFPMVVIVTVHRGKYYHVKYWSNTYYIWEDAFQIHARHQNMTMNVTCEEIMVIIVMKETK